MDLEACQIPLSDQPYPLKGRLWMCDLGRNVILDGIYCSNGIWRFPDNKHMYSNNSCSPGGSTSTPRPRPELSTTVSALWTSGNPAILNSPKTARELRERFLGGEPVGLVMDTEGTIWIAPWNKGCVLCFKPERELTREVRSNDAVHDLPSVGWGRFSAQPRSLSVGMGAMKGSNRYRGQTRYKFAE